jgi:hypothetical protein
MAKRVAFRRETGGGLLVALVAAALVLASAGALALSSANAAAQRARATERALAQAREALVSHAADRPIDDRVGPGYLPCPDLDDDGWAESTCGSLAGHVGQADRLGRLPWKTLGLPDLRDGHGERLWYAVSTRYKGLLNCAASRACVEMTPLTALGTITVRDGSGRVVQDGTLGDPGRAASGGAAAVVIAPGPALRRADGIEQRRDCRPGECDAGGRCIADPPARASRCDPRNYLEGTAGEDNAAFHDRSDTRWANADGFIQAPAATGDAVTMNDRLAFVGFDDIAPRVMRRVGVELAHCLRQSIGAAPPPPAQGCQDPALGRIPEGLLSATAVTCSASAADDGWWAAWRPHVLYLRGAAGGIEVVDARGSAVAQSRRFALLVTQRANECAAPGLDCGAGHCSRVTEPGRSEPIRVLVGGH